MNRNRQAWGVIRSVLLENFTFGTIKAIVGCAGLDPTRMAHLEQTSGHRGSSKSQLLSAIDFQVGEMDEQHVGQFLRIVTEEMLRRQPSVEVNLRESLERLGWTLHKGRLLEVSVLDISELPELPETSHG